MLHINFPLLLKCQILLGETIWPRETTTGQGSVMLGSGPSSATSLSCDTGHLLPLSASVSLSVSIRIRLLGQVPSSFKLSQHGPSSLPQPQNLPGPIIISEEEAIGTIPHAVPPEQQSILGSALCQLQSAPPPPAALASKACRFS